MNVMAQIPKDHPLMKAWESHKQTDEYENSKDWAAHEKHLEGSLWALFSAGWNAALSESKTYSEDAEPCDSGNQ